PGWTLGWSLVNSSGNGYSYQRCNHTRSLLCERDQRSIVAPSYSPGILVGAHPTVCVANCARGDRLPLGYVAQVRCLPGSVANKYVTTKSPAVGALRYACGWRREGRQQAGITSFLRAGALASRLDRLAQCRLCPEVR